jgi:hypothetical protein
MALPAQDLVVVREAVPRLTESHEKNKSNR